MSKVAIILMNYGGPNSIEDVRSYLKNIFMDKAIIRAPLFVRYFLANKISKKRANKSKKIYQAMGGKSNIDEYTKAQGEALVKALTKKIDVEAKAFAAQRYFKPFVADIMDDVVSYQPDHVILLPMYPHYSTTTTQSSIDNWFAEAKKIKNKHWQTSSIKYFYQEQGFEDYYVREITSAMPKDRDDVVIIFSAHGILQSYVDMGDVYDDMVLDNINNIANKLKNKGLRFEHKIAWQSKVGKHKWLEPSLEDVIKEHAKKAIILLPLSFVCENSETVVELDMDMKNLAKENGNNFFERIATPYIDDAFIDSLADKVVAKIQTR